MYPGKTSPSSVNHELIFAITRHIALGYLIEPFAVVRNSKNQFEYGFKKLTKNTVWDYFSQLPDEYSTVLDMLDRISDENLRKRFNPKSPKISRFYETLDEGYITRYIRPFLEKTLYTCAEHLTENGIPLYYKGDGNERIQETPIRLHRKTAETCLHFERLPVHTLYRLEVRHEDNDLLLYKKNGFLLTNFPCLLVLDGQLLRFEPDWDGKKLQPFFEKEYLIVPKSAEKQFFQKFVQKSILYQPFRAIGFDVRVTNQKPVAVLRMEEHWQGGVVLGLYFRYNNGNIFRFDDPAKEKVRFRDGGDDIAFDKVVRDEDFEKSLDNLLRSLSINKIDGPFYSLFNIAATALNTAVYNIENQVTRTIDWFSENHEILSKNGIETEKVIFNKSYRSGKYVLNLKTSSKNDWFDLYGMVQFGEFEIPFAYLTENILIGNREYVLPDNTIALIPEEWMSRYKDIVKFGHRKGNSILIKNYHYSILREAVQDRLKVPQFFWGGKLIDHSLPTTLNAQLRNYQRDGYNWMMFLRNNRLGGCLADDMGLGKTLQTLAILLQTHSEEIFENPNSDEPNGLSAGKLTEPKGQLNLFESIDTINQTRNCSMVVMPLSLVHNWQQEITRFAPGLKVYQHTGTARATSTDTFNDYHLVLTTYGTVRNDIEMLEKYQFSYIVLDESQIIKNASSRIFMAIRRLNTDFRMVLTGTPIENSLTDLWSQFSFINPGMLGSYSFFKKEFVFPIEKRNDEKTGTKLHKLVEPFILRRTKQQVASELPPLSEKIHYCEMTPEQEQYYETRKSEIRNAIAQSLHDKGVDKARFFILSGLTKLRLIANHPSIIDNTFSHGSGKYIEIIRSIENLLAEGHKVLIFSQFVKYLNLFADEFNQREQPFSYLTGKVDGKDRQAVITDFQSGEKKQLFLISLKAGGLGLNLTEADYVFILDPWWNPAVERQAINRAHRIGQVKNVFVYKFITRNTVEEKILKLQQKKSDLAGMFINDNNPLKTLSIEELSDLL